MDKNITILAYHGIGASFNNETGADSYVVSAERFREQMEHILQVAESKDQQFIITFDDGDITNYTNAYPKLKEMTIKGYFFIIASRIGRTGYMSWEQVKELDNEGMVIGSHGTTHRILTVLNDDELNYELSMSKKIIEDNLKHSIDYISIPRGFYNKKIIDKAKEFGYKAVFTSDPRDSDGFKLSRIVIRKDWSLNYFDKAINSNFSFKNRIGEILKNSTKRILGAKNYDKIRTQLLTR
jgi:peptidoglycan/xylan/chitin deacetylase (PgdA/CDA1 family)